jgi:uncharacterized protein (UPF0332 family)
MNELWSKAVEAADDAKLLLRADRYNGASNRAYYAMFNAARALLIEKCQAKADELKRHATILRLFSKHFVETGLFEPEFGPIMRRASNTRFMADYEATQVSKNDAQATVDAMDRFMAIASTVRHK